MGRIIIKKSFIIWGILVVALSLISCEKEENVVGEDLMGTWYMPQPLNHRTARRSVEDVGRHSAVDKIAGYMFLNKIKPTDKIFYTTGRLTSEMIIKTVQMRIPILISRSGFTAWGVNLAIKANLTLIGRAKGRRFSALSGLKRIIFDADPKKIKNEKKKYRRKSSEGNR